MDEYAGRATDGIADPTRLPAMRAVFHGDRDFVVPSRSGRWWSDRLGGCSFNEIHDGTHFVAWTHAHEILKQTLG
jgi:pimeloyl-ACP methyl ester carboxylesterase